MSDELRDGRNRRTLVFLMVVAVVLANAAFIGLGSVFNYPDILQEPAETILADFRAEEGAIVSFFLLLALSAALLAPIAILLGKLGTGDAARWSIRVGVAAAVVQVIGLLRWPLVVPSLADSSDTGAFDTVHTVLGTVVGETFGYLLTAAWTVLIISAVARHLAGRWFASFGYASAALIAVGVLVPLNVPGADFANFIGYVLWSIWMLTFAVFIWRRLGEPTGPEAAVPSPGEPAGARV